MEYFLILLVLALITLLLEKKFHVHLYHNRIERCAVVIMFFIIGIIWDSYAIIRGHWYFPADKTLGIKIGVMPLEEYLFIFVVPYMILTLYTIVHHRFDNPFVRFLRKIFGR